MGENSTDINEAFEAITFAEDAFSNTGFGEGHAQGVCEGQQEGLHIGLEKGREVGRELGFYQGFAQAWLDRVQLQQIGSDVNDQKTRKSVKTVSQLEKLVDLIGQIPPYNKRDVDLTERVNAIRARFKTVCSLLGVTSEWRDTTAAVSWMKFVLEQVARTGERAAHLDLRGKVFATPFPLVTTRGGAVPHLTRETLSYLGLAESAVLLPYQYHATQTDILQKYGRGLGSFVGLSDSLSVLTIQDPGAETRSGYHGNKNVSVWVNCNREVIDSKKYAEFVRVAQVDLVVQLCDGDTPKDATRKRISKATKKSLEFLDALLELRDNDSDFKDLAVLAAIEGGLDSSARQFSASQTAKRPVNGFLIDGFHNNGSPAETLCWAEVNTLFNDTVRLLPREKPRFYFGPANPTLIFHLLAAGVDVFDTSYANLVTDRDSALIFRNHFNKSTSSLVATTPTEDAAITTKFEVDLRLDRYKLVMEPLVADCDCYTCRNFTAAYVHHLVVTGEMLARVLLTLHNLHHYQTFFQSLREAIVCDRVDTFRQSVLL